MIVSNIVNTTKSIFLTHVYEWLNKPTNRCVEDLHYAWADKLSKRELYEKIYSFLAMRLYQGESINPDYAKDFLDKVTHTYIRNMYR